MSELSNIFEDKKNHPHDCVRPDNKDSRRLRGKSRIEKYGEGIEILNMNNEFLTGVIINWNNTWEYSRKRGGKHHSEIAAELPGV